MASDDKGKFMLGDRPLRPDADKGREPELFAGRMGTRMVSRAALVERIITAFYEEHGENSPAIREAKTQAQRLRLVLDTAEYVLAVESVVLTNDEKAALVRQVFSDLFGYGPLDQYLTDPDVTTIFLHGPDHASVRYKHAELNSVGPLFEDQAHLRRIMGRLLLDADAELREDEPAIETGLKIADRRVSVTLVAPPISPVLSVDIRLHPAQPPSLDALVADDMLTSEAAFMLRSLLASPYGIILVGEAETGKTTLLNALLQLLPQSVEILTVERSGELALPEGAQRLLVEWPVGVREGKSFGQQIGAALAQQPDVLVLDEVRADEPSAIAPLLESPEVPRQLWTFRGVPDAKRLQSSLGMLARRATHGQGEAPVHALYERLPFVITVQRIRERLQVFSIAEWQPNPTSDYPDYVMLFQYQNGASRPTGKKPSRAVALG